MNTTTTPNGTEQGQADADLTVQQRDIIDCTEALLMGLAGYNPDLLTPQAARLHTVAREISAGGPQDRLRHALMLTALCESPEAVMDAIRTLRAELVATDPLLAALR